ncbi:hypothetical protein FRC12_001984 [Ceratobasidium sp. 428]|nr:hypothetical protein FRC12_001984 [Ceratobasidium sp. 428]
MSPQAEDPIRIVCISDTHNAQPPIPDGDILIHAGDLTNAGSASELRQVAEWLSSLPHLTKLVIGGNHDRGLDAKLRAAKRNPAEDPEIDWSALGIIYLEHSSAQITVLGRELRYPQAHLSPERARAVWEDIPLDTDILITHGPPIHHLDMTRGSKSAGCPALLDKIRRVQPILHVFGHIHESRGIETVDWGFKQRMKHAWVESDKKTLGAVSRFARLTWDNRLNGSRRPTILVNAAIQPPYCVGDSLNEAQVVVI